MGNYWPDRVRHDFLCLLCSSLSLKEQGKQVYGILHIPPSKAMDGELDLMRFRGWDRLILST